MLSAFDPRMDNSTARNQIKVHASNLTSSIPGLNQGEKKKLLSSLIWRKYFSSFFLWRIRYVACSQLSRIQARWRYLCPEPQRFRFYETDHVLDQYSSSSSTRIKFCCNCAIRRIPHYYLSNVLWFWAKGTLFRLYISYINMKKVDPSQLNDKCKERKNLVLHLTDTKFVTSREKFWYNSLHFLKRKRNRGNISIESHYIIFTLKSFTEWQDAKMLSKFSRNKNWLKVIFRCFLAFSFLLACSYGGAWLDMRILFYFLAIHDMDFAKLSSRRP